MGLLPYSEPDRFYANSLPSRTHDAAALTNLVLLAVVFFLLIRALRKLLAAGKTKAAAGLFLIPALVVLNGLRMLAAEGLPILRSQLMQVAGERTAFWLAAAALILMAERIYAWRNRLLRIAALMALLLSPFVLFSVGQTVVRIIYPPAPLPAYPPPATRLPPVAQGHIRVVWVIFDELDYRLAFVDRPGSVAMTEFDRLRGESLFATHASSPATDTLPSIPSLLSGRLFARYQPAGPDDLLLFEPGSPAPERWSGPTTIFASARRKGLNTGVIGFYIPYCRVLNDVLTGCSWYETSTRANASGFQFVTVVGNQLRSLAETSFFSLFGQSLFVKRRVRYLGELHENACKMASDPDFGLVFLHYPVPHAPHPYDRITKSFTKANTMFAGYPDSLALADRLLGQLREAITRAGLWDSTLLLVSSDHPYRNSRQIDGKSDPRVPFLVKLPGQRTSVEYSPPMHTLVSRGLLEAALEGAIRTPEDAAKWLEGR